MKVNMDGSLYQMQRESRSSYLPAAISIVALLLVIFAFGVIMQ